MIILQSWLLSFLEKPRNIIIYYVLETPQKPVLAMEREARRKLKLCFINVLELANTHQQRYSRTAEIASTL